MSYALGQNLTKDEEDDRWRGIFGVSVKTIAAVRSGRFQDATRLIIGKNQDIHIS